MKLSVNWLKDFVDVNISPKELANKLTLAGLEVENITEAEKDTVLNLKLTSNRADCMSVLGVAREVGALTSSKVKFLIKSSHPERSEGSLKAALRDSSPATRDQNDKQSIKLHIVDAKLCPRMYAALLTNIKIAPSPAWMQERLAVCGVKAINNVVDITNYVMLELGQPLHAFDGERLSGSTIYVRYAKQSEKITTLDNKERELTPDTLVLTDEQGPIDIAGIQGGLESAVQNGTNSIVLTASQLNSSVIRRTSRRMRFSTDASQRFERGLDPLVAEAAMARAMQLLQEHAGAEVAAITSIVKDGYKPVNISVSPEEVLKVLGAPSATPALMKTIFTKLGFSVKGSAKKWTIGVPSWRRDVTIAEDIVEEVGRMMDYNTLPISAQTASLVAPSVNHLYTFKEQLRDLMVGAGFDEVTLYSFYGPQELKGFALEGQPHYELQNPMNPDQAMMRQSLLPRLVQAAVKNLARYDMVSIFEMGTVFEMSGTFPKQPMRLCALTTGKDSLSRMLGILHMVTDNVGIDRARIAVKEEGGAHHVVIEGAVVGRIDSVTKDMLITYDVATPMAFFTLFPEVLVTLRKSPVFQSFALHPVIQRDISFVIKKDVPYKALHELISKASPLIQEVRLFDTFEDKVRFGGDQWSMAFRVVFQHAERTLTSEEVEAVMSLLRTELTTRFSAAVR